MKGLEKPLNQTLQTNSWYIESAVRGSDIQVPLVREELFGIRVISK